MDGGDGSVRVVVLGGLEDGGGGDEQMPDYPEREGRREVWRGVGRSQIAPNLD